MAGKCGLMLALEAQRREQKCAELGQIVPRVTPVLIVGVGNGVSKHDLAQLRERIRYRE